MILNDVHTGIQKRKPRKRIGRGSGSGRGKTSGRGHNGYFSRSGSKRRQGFEGGQMPLYQRLPKRGFNKPNRKEYAVINLGLIQKFIDAGKIDIKAEITEEALVASGALRRIRDGVRVLAKGDFSAKVKINVTGASKGAVEAVEKAGGSLTVTTAAAAE